MCSFYNMCPREELRRFHEKKIVQEGVALWKEHKENLRKQHLEEQKKLRIMLEKYHPWGKPGGGAPNESIRMKNITFDELIPYEELRKQDALRLGRPGGGAPRKTYSGRKIVTMREDPALRFQYNESMRRCVNNKLRYHTEKQKQHEYRRDLDAIVAEQRKARDAEKKEKLDYARKLESQTPPWGKTGPGGRPWRAPPTIGLNFLKSLGWSTEKTLKKIEKDNWEPKERIRRECREPKLLKKRFQHQQQLEKISEEKNNNDAADDNGENDKENEIDKTSQSSRGVTGGVELVPLLAKRRAAAIRLPLVSTDVTRDNCRIEPVDSHYLRELSKQVYTKNKQIKESKYEDVQNSRRHFETWESFWGRPGHGAPISENHQKRRLDQLLYQPKVF